VGYTTFTALPQDKSLRPTALARNFSSRYEADPMADEPKNQIICTLAATEKIRVPHAR
jgi:hypothetical protein